MGRTVNSPGVSFRPSNEAQLVDFLAGCAASGSTVEICGGGTKRGLGRPGDGRATTLDLRDLAGILVYEPAELVLTARAGTPLPDIERAVRERGQCLAFEPPDFCGLLGVADAVPTLGGVVGAGLSGPRRFKAGAVRDHVLGAVAVGGDGKLFKSGGRVVKNVTGFDLPKVLTGSYGTLAALTEITIKVLPAPEASRTLLLCGLESHDAVVLLSRMLGGPFDISGAAHLPVEAARRSSVAEISAAAISVTAFRLEGFGPSVDDRIGALKSRVASSGGLLELSGEAGELFWAQLRDVGALIDPGYVVWRLSLPPSEAARTVAAIARGAPAEAVYDWGGGLVWLAIPPAADAHAALVRGCLPSGHATLIRAPDEVRARVGVFQPVLPALAELSRRVKDAFDPGRILNPGRMVAEH